MTELGMTWMAMLGTLALFAGTFFVVVAAIGLVKLPDIYCRSHALGKAVTLGIILLLIGYGLRVPEVSWLKLTFVLIFQLVTIPVTSHLFCLIAYRKDVRRWLNGAASDAGVSPERAVTEV